MASRRSIRSSIRISRLRSNGERDQAPWARSASSVSDDVAPDATRGARTRGMTEAGCGRERRWICSGCGMERVQGALSTGSMSRAARHRAFASLDMAGFRRGASMSGRAMTALRLMTHRSRADIQACRTLGPFVTWAAVWGAERDMRWSGGGALSRGWLAIAGWRGLSGGRADSGEFSPAPIWRTKEDAMPGDAGHGAEEGSHSWLGWREEKAAVGPPPGGTLISPWRAARSCASRPWAAA